MGGHQAARIGGKKWAGEVAACFLLRQVLLHTATSLAAASRLFGLPGLQHRQRRSGSFVCPKSLLPLMTTLSCPVSVLFRLQSFECQMPGLRLPWMYALRQLLFKSASLFFLWSPCLSECTDWPAFSNLPVFLLVLMSLHYRSYGGFLEIVEACPSRESLWAFIRGPSQHYPTTSEVLINS